MINEFELINNDLTNNFMCEYDILEKGLNDKVKIEINKNYFDSYTNANNNIRYKYYYNYLFMIIFIISFFTVLISK